MLHTAYLPAQTADPDGSGGPAAPGAPGTPAVPAAPVAPSTVGGILRAAAARDPGAPAVVESRAGAPDLRRWTYQELLDDAEAAARALLRRFAPGEHVAVWAPNSAEWLVLEFGIALAGMVLVTVNPAFRAAEVRHVLATSRAAGLFLVSEYRGNPMRATVESLIPALPALREVIDFADWNEFIAAPDEHGSRETVPPDVVLPEAALPEAGLRETVLPEAGLPEAGLREAGLRETVLPEVAPSAIAQIQFTSGTTGTPKGTMLTHSGITNNARLAFGRLGFPPGSSALHSLPFFHTGGAIMLALGPVQNLWVHVLIDGFDPARMLELIETEKVDVLFGVPTMFAALLEHPDFADRDLSSLKAVFSGGASITPTLVEKLEKLFDATYMAMFGQTEASGVVSATSFGDSTEVKATSVGRPLPHTEVKIVAPEVPHAQGSGSVESGSDETGSVESGSVESGSVESGSDAVGIRGDAVGIGEVGELLVRGYGVMAGYFELPDASRATLDAEGWLHTGDLCTMDGEGNLRVVGRIKEMIIRGGENIFPPEIEKVLASHPSIAEVAVVGVPDEHWGEQVAAFVRLAPGAELDVDELTAFTRERLAGAKCPRFWQAVDAFPLTASGKVQKFRLRQAWERAEEPS